MKEIVPNVMQVLVLLKNTIDCKDNDCDAEKTAKELIRELGRQRMRLWGADINSYLYMCNMNNEQDAFWHPEGKSFDAFLSELLPKGYDFDKTNNYIKGKKTP